MIRVSTMHVVLMLCIACLVASEGQAEVDDRGYRFSGISLAIPAQEPGLSQPFIGLTGFWDVERDVNFSNTKVRVGVLGQFNVTRGTYGRAWSLSPMLCLGKDLHKNNILHATAGFAWFNQPPGAISSPFGFEEIHAGIDKIKLTLGVSYTRYVPTPDGERFALNFGLQLWKAGSNSRYMFTITPGFLTFGGGD